MTRLIGWLMLLVLLVGFSGGGLAAAQERELSKGTPGRWYTFTALNGLAGNIVQAIWEDAAGRIWFGTENGASHYDGRTWRTYRTVASQPGLVDNNVWAIAGDAETVWFATSNGVSSLRQDAWRSYTVADGLPTNDVRAILVASDGVVWAGTFGGGIVRKNPASERWERLDLTAQIAEPNVIVQSIWEAPAGQIWFGTNGSGALRLNQAGLERFEFKEPSRNTVWSITSAPQSSTIWMTTFQGIASIAANQVTVIGAVVQGLPLSTTETLAVATRNPDSIWFGTRAHGVVHSSNGVWQRYTTADGLSRNYVQTILVDRQERVWFGTRGGGVTLLNPQPPAADQSQLSITTRDIQQNVDLPGDQRVLGFDQNNLQWTFHLPVAWLPAQSVGIRYWLTTATGLGAAVTLFSPPAPEVTIVSAPQIDLRPGSYTLHSVPIVDGVAGQEQIKAFTIRSAPPQFSADALTVLADGLALTDGATLTPDLFGATRPVEIHFAASDDAPAAQLVYEYRVAGGGWQRAPGSSAQLDLTQGTHQIDVQAIDPDGNHSTQASMTIVVPAPFWQALLLYLTIISVPTVLGAAGGAWWYRRWAERQALRRAVRGNLIPYDVGPLISAPERYIGRQHVLDALLGRIEHNSFYIYGEKRIGKTSLLVQIRQRLIQRNQLQREKCYIPVFFNMQDVPQAQFWRLLIRSIADAVPAVEPSALALAQPRADYNDFDAQDDLDSILATIQAPSEQPEELRQPSVVLLLDEVDTLQRYDAVIRQRFRAFCQHTQAHVQVILVGVRPPQAEASDTSPWYNIFAPLPLEPLDRAATLFLIRSYNQNPYAYTAEAEQMILELSDLKPFDTQWLCAEAVKAMLAAQRTTVLAQDVVKARDRVLAERRREYLAIWQQLPATIQAQLQRAAAAAGRLPADQLEYGGAVLDAGLIIKTSAGYQLAALFQRWLRELQ